MTLLQDNPAALVIFGSQLADKTHQILGKTNIPTINVVGSPFSPVQITIETAFFEALHKLTEYLLEQGYRNTGSIDAHMNNRLQRQRLNGRHKAILSHYQNSNLVVTILDAASLQLGRCALNEVLLQQPELDAVVCNHEEVALGIMFEYQRRLLRIPENTAAACLDGSDNCDQTHPVLIPIRIDYKEMGIETGELPIGLLNNNHDKSEESRVV